MKVRHLLLSQAVIFSFIMFYMFPKFLNNSRSMEKELLYLQRSLDGVKQESESLQGQLQAARDAKKMTEDQISTLQEQVSQHKGLLDKKTEELKRDAEAKRALEEKQKTLEQSNKELEEKHRTLADSKKALEDKQKTFEDSKMALEESKKTLEESKKALEDKTKSLEDSKRLLEEKQRSLEAALKMALSTSSSSSGSGSPATGSAVVGHVTSPAKFDDVRVFHQSRGHVLVVTLINNIDSWGKSGRSLGHFLKLVRTQNFPPEKMSIAVLVSDDTEFRRMYNWVLETRIDREYARITLIHKTFNALGRVPGWQKHLGEAQPERRRVLSMARNYLIMTALRDEEFVLWIDSDMTHFGDPNMLKEMIESGKDIITPNCGIGDTRTDYDWNSWRGERKRPSPEQMAAIVNKTYYPFFEPGLNREKAQIVDHIRKADPEKKTKFVEIDSVGGTVLFVRADAHRKGASFSPFFIIGAQWEHYGWDAMETESLCYYAKAIGYKCWAMPHTNVTHHW